MSVRTASALVAAILALLIGWTAVELWNRGDPLVVPTGGVTAGGPKDTLPTGGEASEALTQRTELQRPRVVSGPSPEGAESKEIAAAGAAMPETGDADRPPAALVDSWLANREADLGLLRDRGFVEGWTSLPDPRADVLMQPQGRDFRRLHNEELVYGGAWVVLGVGLLLALVLVLRGRIPLAEGFSGATVLRFNWIERANHWMTAASGIVLTLTGLTLLYGRYVIRPLIGAEPYSTMASASVYLHIAFMPPFLIGVLVMVALWLRQNIPSRLDLHWLARAGGFFNNSPDKPPARRFNAGQKVMFWSAFLGMLGLALTGFTLMFPFFWGGIWVMQAAQIVHAVIALLFVAVLLGHIWIGTIGMVGAFDAMWSGRVDRNWVHEHHRLWLEKLEEEGKAPPHPAERQSTERQPAE